MIDDALARYKKHREEMEKYFVPENALPNPKEHCSPSGKYLLRITGYSTKPGCWNYSRGEIFRGSEKIADVKRNYHAFPFAWVEGHPKGDFFLGGEDYQGQTIVELDTGKRVDTEPDDRMQKGWGFCWASIHPSPDKKVIAVDGCYWACPYEVVLFDFREPMKLPLPELERWDEAEGFESWETEGRLLLSRTIDVRKSDGKPYDDLTDAEQDAMKNEDFEEKKLTKLWEPKSLTEVRP